MTARRRLAASLLVCGLLVGAGAGTALSAAKPSPNELWELYPLDPTGRGASTRPSSTTADGPRSPPRGGVAGTRTVVTSQDGSRDEDTPLSLALLVGGLVGAILLLSLAALPPSVTPRLARIRADHRIDMALAGAVTLLVITVVYLASML